FLNLAHPPAPLRLGIAGWPALAFLGGTLLAHSAEHRTPLPPAPAPTPAPDADPEHVTTPTPEPQHEPAPALTQDAPALPVSAPAPAVPAVLVDHARKVADEYRTRTGSPIDTDTLRARLGVPPHLADAIAAHLA
ncbi:SpdA protein, partial [Streptomyces sp. NPDC002573]